MPSKSSRKRKRSQAFTEDDMVTDQTTQNEDGESEAGDDETEEQINVDEEGTEKPPVDPEKEREIWESVREEHYEVVEQLPLTMHRQFTLLKELDQESQACMDDILPTLKRYIALRRDLDAQHKARTVPQQEASAPENPSDITQMAAEGDSERHTDAPMDVDPQPEELNRTTTGHAVSADGSPLFTPVTSKDPTPPPPTATTVNSSPPPTSATTHATPPPTTATTTTSSIPLPSTPIRAIPHHLSTQNLTATASPRTPTPIGIPQDRNRIPTTSREMLTHIAWASDEMIRASNEKVHIAQTLHDTLERQIRALNQSIKEQELALSLGTRPGTQLAPILLPEIAPVSRWTKPSNPTSDIDSDDDLPNGGLFEPDGEQGDTITTLGVVSDDPGGGRKRGKRAGNNRSEKLKIKLPASAAAANSNEIYCYCRMTSWGEMIMCDNHNCKNEWFHLSCTGLTQLPPEKQTWFCRDCEPKYKKSGRGRKK